MATPHNPADRLMVALDFPTTAEALAFVDRLSPSLRWVKVGMELFYAAGPDIVRQLRDRNLQVFLDLKLHDIPNTVASAVRSVADLGASILNVHATGGPAMMAAARDAAAGRIQLIAVTVLTSMDAAELSAIGLDATTGRQVQRLARLAITAGMDGLVCSTLEVAQLRRDLGPAPLLVVPGIRPTGSDANDQRRIATPTEAITAGASHLVIGRPITRAVDPALALHNALAEISLAIDMNSMR